MFHQVRMVGRNIYPLKEKERALQGVLKTRTAYPSKGEVIEFYSIRIIQHS
ncbi:MAG TPA: hypothetical protein VJK51_01420 [Candidatus Nanoarchaeia archaeon]|nr:hypothetical protein [Candidatus Nanoarchaeia archaeon]